MPGLKHLLRKKEKIEETTTEQPPTDEKPTEESSLNVPEFKIIRSTTEAEEEIEAPTFADHDANGADTATNKPKKSAEQKYRLHFRKSSNAAFTRDPTAVVETAATKLNSKSEKRLSSRFSFHSRSRSRSASADTSEILPEDLPEAPEAIGVRSIADDLDQDREAQERREAQWEKRATLLAQKSPLAEAHQQDRRTAPSTAQPSSSSHPGSRSRSPSISDKRGDDDIQEAIRLHELGELKLSTAMFGRLGDPRGQNNALAQVLYGLALRHGWGVPVDSERAIHFLSLAAANSASVEQAALDAGMHKGGAAKGELVLAMFELANCFRHGWGVKVDRPAARQYYETAANLGDTDAMEEAAWCFMEGFGGPKDKFKAAQYLRLAEEKGKRQVGNSWIWKDKYNPK